MNAVKLISYIKPILVILALLIVYFTLSSFKYGKFIPLGFSYHFKEDVIYTPKSDIYIVGQHCYRGLSKRFDIPRENFTLVIDDKEYPISYAGGTGSRWNEYYTGSRLNFIFALLEGSQNVVEIDQSTCVDIYLNTKKSIIYKYPLKAKELIQNSTDKTIRVVVHDGFNHRGNIIGEFNLIVNTKNNYSNIQKTENNPVTIKHSIEAKQRASIRFINSSSEIKKIYWLDYKGNKVLYKKLKPGQEHIQQTFMTHPWVVTDVYGNEVTPVYHPEEKMKDIRIE